MAHSQKSIRDHARPHHQPQANNAAIAEQSEKLVSPAVYAQASSELPSTWEKLPHQSALQSLDECPVLRVD
jgi:hypothetical protein